MSSKRRTREEWAALCSEHDASGQSAREFARRRGVNAATLAWWRSELGVSRQRERGAGVPARFIDVVAAGSATSPGSEAVLRRVPVRVTVRSVTVEVGEVPSGEWLAELVRSC